MPAIGAVLMLAGVTLAVASGLHVKAAIAMARSYEILPKGRLLPQRGEIVIRIGAPIATDRYRGGDKQALAADLHRAVQALLEERYRG